ncbi:hypothetical protein HETIRDRAFT_308780, partial [Heterobasidion irregulare TC 32-1]
NPPLQLGLNALSNLGVTAPASDSGILKAIDDEVAYLCTSIHAMNKLRNHFISISRLPLEILVHIFSILMVINSPRKKYLGWIRTLHACCYWRQATIENSKLWANIPLDLSER